MPVAPEQHQEHRVCLRGMTPGGYNISMSAFDAGSSDDASETTPADVTGEKAAPCRSRSCVSRGLQYQYGSNAARAE